MVVLFVIMFILSACSETKEGAETVQTNATTDEVVQTIEMGQISWAENIAITNMWKVILENEGYKVNFHLLDMGTQMAALESDELDVNLEVWLPIQDKEYLQQYQDTVNFSDETWYDNAKVGLVVPTYMKEVNSIEDLKDYVEDFNGEITGFDPGAGTMLVTEELIKEYNLDYKLLPSSEPAMLTLIEEAIREEKAIVAPLWNPHQIFSELDLKYLEDPKGIYGGVEKIHHATRQGFGDDYPEVSEWLKKWKMDDQEIGQLMSYVSQAEANEEDPLVGAAKWVEENQALVEEWIN